MLPIATMSTFKPDREHILSEYFTVKNVNHIIREALGDNNIFSYETYKAG